MKINILGWMLYGNFLLTTLMYLYLFQYRKLIGFQLGMNISIIVGGITALSTGVVLIYQYPFHFVLITILSTLTGVTIGSLFGGLFDYQTLLTGYGNGMMLGLMSPMIGSAANNNFPFLIFIEMLLMVSYLLLFLSVRRS
ncbi:hypothetical protein [Guptibacillus algicola]|uniref:hypothetical protein n=1 Tax=Guptibacillus algicola TaxID=225844 RepID=UPI001CD1D56C|nr:hypothetical protein [Alkalihalobacillus algicola]MCA0986779.1 hypothetical protein [Alkalihalobacillus algicola]